MILVDTSIWIDHLRRADGNLARLLELGDVAVHRMVLGELAMGSLRDRGGVLEALAALPAARPGAVVGGAGARRPPPAVRAGARLDGRAHLLASTLITPGALLWTRDLRLRIAAHDLGVARRCPLEHRRGTGSGGCHAHRGSVNVVMDGEWNALLPRHVT